MGYYIECSDGGITLPLRNADFACEALKKWLCRQEREDWNCYQSIEDIAAEFDLIARFDETKREYVICNDAEKLWNQQEFLEVIAEFCNEDSYIEIVGECGEFWRWVIKDGKLLEVIPSIDWNPNALVADNVNDAKRLILDIYHKDDEHCLLEILDMVSVVGLTVGEILELVEELKHDDTKENAVKQ